MVLECYDPATPNFKFVREVYLYKNSDYTPFIKRDNSVDFLKETSFGTNGQVLVVQTNNRAYYFDMKSGVRI